MTLHRATVSWRRQGRFARKAFSRAHTWRFDGGLDVPASASPLVVPVPQSVEAAVDPEEALVAALASCHMMTFLFLAAEAGLVVEAYEDDATGRLEALPDGGRWVSEVVLRPRVTFGGEAPGAVRLEELHRAAHEGCFIARSVKTAVRVEPVG